MKILPIEEIRKADAFTILNEPIADIDLMERAAKGVFDWLSVKSVKGTRFEIFCGPGNNGGDGLAVARMLGKAGYIVNVYMLRQSNLSPGCLINFERIREIKSVKLIELKKGDKLPAINNSAIIIDAIFGSGLTRPVTGHIADIVNFINSSNEVVVSIDAPTGFFCDSTNSTNDGAIIKSDYTLTFQFPKIGFLFPENEIYIGEWQIIDIGLHPDFINGVEVKHNFILRNDCARIRKPRSKFSHKGTYGHGLLIAGSFGKMGAAVLASQAGLKSGAGLITAHIPRCGNTIIQTSVPAAMVDVDEEEYFFSSLPDLKPYQAIAVGPGLGVNNQSQKALKLLIQNSHFPIILDADALNIIAENKTWLSFIPKQSILTPHPKEFERLTGKTSDDFERHIKQVNFSIKYHCYVVLKGAHTCITTPEGISYFNSTGNPGIATGGSGDVLTGILLGLLAQGYTPLETCIMGVYLHGLSGDLAANEMAFESIIANTIIDYLGNAFLELQN